ncbi:MAG: hypothetical protein QOK44_1179, partial [Betaproteobacteria bacterium]|nr:hypothetical protein [Betaproteobacteria bacterium]
MTRLRNVTSRMVNGEKSFEDCALVVIPNVRRFAAKALNWHQQRKLLVGAIGLEPTTPTMS